MSGLVVAATVAAALPWATGRAATVGRQTRGRTSDGGRGRAGGGAVGAGGGGTAGRTDVEADVVLVLDLLDVAIASGTALPRALVVVGAAIGGARGRALGTAGTALLLGASWRTAWASAPDELVDVAETLAPSWTTGSAPGPALRAAAEQRRRARRARVRSAAGALGVRLVLPLGLCFLPAFLLLGLVPMVLGLARGLFA